MIASTDPEGGSGSRMPYVPLNVSVTLVTVESGIAAGGVPASEIHAGVYDWEECEDLGSEDIVLIW